jgi:hypothetical protein
MTSCGEKDTVDVRILMDRKGDNLKDSLLCIELPVEKVKSITSQALRFALAHLAR